MTRALLLAILICLPFVARAALSAEREGLIVACYSAERRDAMAASKDLRPRRHMVDRFGGLWTLWANDDGVWWITFRRPGEGDRICDVAFGDGLEAARPRAGATW